MRIGDRFRVLDHPATIYTMYGESHYKGIRRICGHYRHAVNQWIGCELPEGDLEKCDLPPFQ
jgi:hypothetical protein